MNVFIDTNVLLDFYRLSGGDLEELRRIAKLAQNGRITLLVSDYLRDEYCRNRENVIAQAIAQFRKSKVELQLPNLVRVYSQSGALMKLKDEFLETTRELEKIVLNDIHDASLKADTVINEFFASTKTHTVPKGTVNDGIGRNRLSKPPGKADSCGDAIHWEWLLNLLPKGEDLIIVSGDGDFESSLHEDVLSQYLQDEWQAKRSSNCTLYTSIALFLKAHFPDIHLADEVDKLCAIERLETSPNFATTHNAIKKLQPLADFKKEEISRLLTACISNSQISLIIGDDDVRQFVQKMVTLAHDAGLIDEAHPLETMLNELSTKDS